MESPFFREVDLELSSEPTPRYIKQSEVIGKKVVEQRGYIVGEVKDLSFRLLADKVDLAISITYGDAEKEIPWEQVKAIGDVVLLKVEYEPPPKPEKPEAKPSAPPLVSKPTLPAPVRPKVCPNCGYPNDPKNKFCIKCGAKLPG